MPEYSLDVLVNGKPITKYYHEGKLYVEGRQKTDYSIRFRNHTGDRVLAVITVDGLSVMDGEEASYKSGGYVVGPFESVTVKGWRISDEEVAKFTFGAKKNSFAAKSGTPHNTGVIGVAVFKEFAKEYTQPVVTWTNIPDGYRYIYKDTYRPDPFDLPPNWTVTSTAGDKIPGINFVSGTSVKINPDCVVTTTTSAAPVSVDASEVYGSLGTEFGKAEKDEVVDVDFTPQTFPVEVMQIYYDSKQGLIERGVKLTRIRHIARAFPKEGKFCSPPKGWVH